MFSKIDKVHIKYSHFKRFGDVFASLFALLLFSPVILTVIAILLFVNKGKPFFFQERPGKDEKIFTLIKLKTMKDETHQNGKRLSDVQRVTSIGKIIRKSSIDELMQLINVVKGDMSLIGPRPLLVRYLPYYTEEERIRHSVRPGITGLAQISGRNTLLWDERLALDIKYVKNLSFKNDLAVLLKTVKKVFKAEDIILDQQSIMLDLDKYRMGKGKIINSQVTSEVA